MSLVRIVKSVAEKIRTPQPINISVDDCPVPRLNLDEITEVVFYKKDLMTTDLICVEIHSGENFTFYHEEWDGWRELIDQLEELSEFDMEWYLKVVKPAFEPCFYTAYKKQT